MKKITLLMMVFISTSAIAGSHRAQPAAALWWGALDKMNGVIMFNSNKGAYHTLMTLAKNSKPGQNLSTLGLQALITGDKNEASFDLLSLKEATFSPSGKSKDEEDKALAPYRTTHADTRFVCKSIKETVLCFIQR